MEAVLDFDDPNNKPVWRLCQWGTKHSLANAECLRFNNHDIAYENKGKKVLVGSENSEKRDLILKINGKAEYGQKVRKHGESWPHLLVEQDAVTIYRLDELEKLKFRLSLRLIHCENHMKNEEYNPQLHAAQFQIFLIVKNINSQSQDHDNYFWFGVPFFDSRYNIPPPYMAKDAGKQDATGKFIYTIDGTEVNKTPLEGRQWLTVQKNLLPYIKEGLKEAVRKGYLYSSKLTDYAVVNMNMGWEIPGTFDAAMQIRDLDIRTITKD